MQGKASSLTTQGNPRPLAEVEPLVVAIPVPNGIDSKNGIGHKTSLGEHCPKEQFQESWH